MPSKWSAFTYFRCAQAFNFRYFGCHMFMEPFLIIRDPDLIKQICVKDFDAFSEHRTLVGKEAEPLVPRTLFSSTGMLLAEISSKF